MIGFGWKHIRWFGILVLMTGCATYYTRNARFQQAIQEDRPDKALSVLESGKKSVHDKDMMLYHLNKGYLNWRLEQPEQSINDLNTAEDFLDNSRPSMGSTALSMITNPMVKPYQAEDFEKVMINWFKALDFLQLRDFEGALVECRRINLKLNLLNDKYPDHKNRYQHDAFAHLMMGLIYDASFDYNNAFIAYRNAFEIYQKEYPDLFGVQAPEQLKKDLMRTAYQTGFTEELHYYEDLFKTTYQPGPDNTPELVFIWLNGLGPVKAEWGLQFTSIKGEADWATFYNQDADITLPFYMGNYSKQEQDALSRLSMVRVAFPRYQERKPAFTSASVSTADKVFELESTQDIQKIAVKTLQDRMVRELSTALIRVAIKQGMEALARKENSYLGTATSLINAFTEKADTRNWQTLPYNISYARIPLQEGENRLTLHTTGPGGIENTEFTVTAQKGRTYFKALHTTRSLP